MPEKRQLQIKEDKTKGSKKWDCQTPEWMAQVMGMMMGQFYHGMGMRG